MSASKSLSIGPPTVPRRLTIRGRIVFAANSARDLNPIGAAILFAIAWAAGFAGSFAALLVAAAGFAGLYLAKISARELGPPAIENPPAAPVIVPESAVLPISGACGPSSGIADAIAAGLSIRKIEFAGPPAIKVRKVSAPQA